MLTSLSFKTRKWAAAASRNHWEKGALWFECYDVKQVIIMLLDMNKEWFSFVRPFECGTGNPKSRAFLNCFFCAFYM
jgi:hypothetical protein